MTLKEKITDKVQEMPLESSPTQRDIDKYILGVNQLEKIADEFAIGFAEWLINDWHNDERWSIITDRKELLEIYKKEKGL